MLCAETAATAAVQLVPVPSDPSLEEILKTLHVLFYEGQTIEVRGYGDDDVKPYGRRFNDPLAAAKVIRSLDRAGKYKGVYVTLNEVPIKILSGKAAHDEDVTRRRWLLEDFDASTKKKGSATDAEKAATFEVANAAQKFLAQRGWGTPVTADSGNGAHALYRIDLPNTPEIDVLIHEVVKTLGKLFDTSAVTVDPSVFNAARITKAYGTVVRKGDDTPERPHRQSRILDIGDGTVVTIEQLQSLVAEYGTSNEPVVVPTAEPVKSQKVSQQKFEEFLEHCGLNCSSEPFSKRGKTGLKYHLESCPWSKEHSGEGDEDTKKDADVFFYDDGGFGFKCFHSHCVDRHWKEFRAWGEERFGKFDFVEHGQVTVGATVSPEPSARLRMSHAELIAESSATAALPEIVEDLTVVRTVNLNVGDSGLGKTPLFLQKSLCIASGLPFLGQSVQRGRVMIIDYENYSTLVNMLDALAEYLHIPTPLDESWFAVLRNPDHKEILREVEAFKPSFILVDALRGFDKKADGDTAAAMARIDWCQDIARAFDCSWDIIHHVRKQERTQDPTKRIDLFDLSTSVMSGWMEEAAGTKALTNQTFTRTGIAKPKGDADLGLRGNVKGRGDFGPWLVQRIYNENGAPVGYARITGRNLLKGQDPILLEKLPIGQPLKFSEVGAIIGHDPNNRKPTVAFLNRCEDAKVIVPSGPKQSPLRRYTRIAEGGEQCPF
jgi:hypothetical protein